MDKIDVLKGLRGLGESRAEIALALCESPLAPRGKELSPSALGMWFTRGSVALMWEAAVLERLGHIEANAEAAA